MTGEFRSFSYCCCVVVLLEVKRACTNRSAAFCFVRVRRFSFLEFLQVREAWTRVPYKLWWCCATIIFKFVIVTFSSFLFASVFCVCCFFFLLYRKKKIGETFHLQFVVLLCWLLWLWPLPNTLKNAFIFISLFFCCGLLSLLSLLLLLLPCFHTIHWISRTNHKAQKLFVLCQKKKREN